jgi:NADPH-dependent curcumin reductase CurA
MAEVKSDVKKLLEIANRSKGGWAVIAAFSAVAGAVGGLVGMLVKLKGGG